MRSGARMSEIVKIDGATAAQSASSVTSVKKISSTSLPGINIGVLLIATFRASLNRAPALIERQP